MGECGIRGGVGDDNMVRAGSACGRPLENRVHGFLEDGQWVSLKVRLACLSGDEDGVRQGDCKKGESGHEFTS